MNTLVDIQIDKLNMSCAYIKNAPIYNAEQMKKHVVCNKETSKSFEKSLRLNYKNCIRATDEGFNEKYPEFVDLKNKLLSFGGKDVIIPMSEPDLDNIMKRGQFWYGDKSILEKGRPNQCHKNSCDLWYANKDNSLANIHIVTGYALGKDGLWLQHTWLVWEKAKQNVIVETTLKRAAYFGYVMTYQEADIFDGENY
jgi:hypothetical protein